MTQQVYYSKTYYPGRLLHKKLCVLAGIETAEQALKAPVAVATGAFYLDGKHGWFSSC